MRSGGSFEGSSSDSEPVRCTNHHHQCSKSDGAPANHTSSVCLLKPYLFDVWVSYPCSSSDAHHDRRSIRRTSTASSTPEHAKGNDTRIQMSYRRLWFSTVMKLCLVEVADFPRSVLFPHTHGHHQLFLVWCFQILCLHSNEQWRYLDLYLTTRIIDFKTNVELHAAHKSGHSLRVAKIITPIARHRSLDNGQEEQNRGKGYKHEQEPDIMSASNSIYHCDKHCPRYNYEKHRTLHSTLQSICLRVQMRWPKNDTNTY